MNEVASRTQVQESLTPLVGKPDSLLPTGYEAIEVLGKGGMGIVYRAKQTDLGRDVALKMVLSGGHASSEELSRFELEAKAIGAIEHPNVVRVFHAGSHSSRPFLALELLTGGSLADLLKDGPLFPQDAARIVCGVARGVAACHAVGILHRDLKPGNVLIDGSSGTKTPKVSDFGLAKRLDNDSELTSTGAVVGTPAYMSPEQALGEIAGVSADVYGIGSVLYATLTGRPPFQAPSKAEIFHKVIHDEPISIRQLQPKVHRDLVTICDKCLSKKPERRYPSAAEVADDLQRWLDHKPILARPAGLIERTGKLIRRNRAITAVMIALTVGFGTALWQAIVANIARIETAEEAKNVETNLMFFRDVLTQSSVQNQIATKQKVNPNLPVKDALDYAAKTLGDRFPGKPLREAGLRVNVGQVYYELGRLDSAAEQFNDALAIYRANISSHDPKYLALVNDLGETYRRLNQTEKAIECLTEAAVGRQAVHGRDKEYYQTINNLGLALQKSNIDLAEKHLRDAFQGRTTILGENDPLTLKSINNLGVVMFRKKAFEEAESCFIKSLSGRRTVLTNKHPETIDNIFNLGSLYLMWDPPSRIGKAESLFREGIQLSLQVDSNNWQTITYRLHFASLLLSQKKYAEAEEHISGAWETISNLKEISAADRFDRMRKVKKLGIDLYQQWGNTEKLQIWQSKTKDVELSNKQ